MSENRSESVKESNVQKMHIVNSDIETSKVDELSEGVKKLKK